MQYTNEKALEEILKRSEKIKKQKEIRKIRLFSSLTILLFAGLVTSIIAIAEPGAAQSAKTAYGAFLLSSKAGGYILVAVIAFVVGVVLTFLISKYKKIHNDEKDS